MVERPRGASGGPGRRESRDVLSAEEAAELLKVSKKTLYRLANTGELPGRKVGRAWRFLRRDIHTFLSGGRRR